MRIPWPCSESSPNGEWKIEALADLKKVKNFEFPPFTFRLSRFGNVLWENTELNRGDGPRKLFISDQGRVVIETYGHEYAVLLVLSPEGKETGKIVITDLSGESRSRIPWGSRVVFDSLGRSTHCLPWSQYALIYFVTWKGMEHLSFLFPCGQRFLVWLEAGIPVVNPSQDLIHECELFEQEWARSRLESVPAEDLSMELAIVVRHRMLDLLPSLHSRVEHWPLGVTQRSRGVPLNRDLRLSWGGCLLSLAFQVLGTPDEFTRTLAALDGISLVDRVHYEGRGLNVNEKLSGLELLAQAGCPDFIHPWVAPEHEAHFCGQLPWDPEVQKKISEFWDYYRNNGELLRVFWEPPEIVNDWPLTGVKIRRLETVRMTPEDWDGRLAYLVQRWHGLDAARIVSISTDC